MKSFPSPSVSIDGEAIRRIREAGKLTQLYVSKVVGVTTDTVSRWENNRYPTIRRDNALRLAEALEVELESILKKDESPVSEPQSDLSPAVLSRPIWKYVVFGILFLIIVGGVSFYSNQNPAPENPLSGHRHIPKFTAPGSKVPVQLEILSKIKLKGLIVREEFPPGWKLVEADPPPASLDNLNGHVRWMIRNPSQTMKIVYLLKLPGEAVEGTEVRFQGEVVANPSGQRFSFSVPATEALKIAPLHWADMNGDSNIDDLEILDVSDMVDASEMIHYDWDQIEELWDAGGYSYDEGTKTFLPQKPAPMSK